MTDFNVKEPAVPAKHIYLPKVTIYPEPSVGDPAHLIAFGLPNGAMFSGSRVTFFFIRLLAYFIRKEIARGYSKYAVNCPYKGPGVVCTLLNLCSWKKRKADAGKA